MSIVTLAPDDLESPHSFCRTTNVHLNLADLASLDTIRETTKLTRNGLNGLADSAMLDHVSRTGKLPYSQARKSTKGGLHGIA